MDSFFGRTKRGLQGALQVAGSFAQDTQRRVQGHSVERSVFQVFDFCSLKERVKLKNSVDSKPCEYL